MRRSAWQSQGRRCAIWTAALALVAGGVVSGCIFAGKKKQTQPFFTSGSANANQRASQYMAKKHQLGATSGGSESSDTAVSSNRLTLYERLGAQVGISNIVADFLPRAIDDPRVNWDRQGAGGGGFFSRKIQEPVWQRSPTNMAVLQQHMVQFLELTTGGPAKYTGRDIKSVHASMKILNAEFDAVIGDFKATLDRLQVPDREQKELLAIIETTRPLIVTVH